MLPGMEILACPNLAVSAEVMQHIVQVESGGNPFAIGVVGGQLARQPRNMDEALATAKMLELKGYNFSLGIAQVNRSNLGRYGIDSYREAFDTCGNLAAGAKILAGCYGSAHGDWGKAFSCYYSGNFTTGFRDGYVQKVYASIHRDAETTTALSNPVDRAIPLAVSPTTNSKAPATALRPEVVYASDSGEYRKALRSVAIDTAAAAMMPLVVSAAGQLSHLETTVPADAMVERPSEVETGQMMSQSVPDPGVQPSSTTAGVQRSAKPGGAETMSNGVFEPQVRGPNDPKAQPAAVAQNATQPRTDSADLRMDKHDASFVF